MSIEARAAAEAKIIAVRAFEPDSCDIILSSKYT